jgi:DNA-binding NarL/FixJ family response regulator
MRRVRLPTAPRSARLGAVDADDPDQQRDTRAPLRVVLADDSVLLREGIARLLAERGFEIVGQAGNADELLLKVRSYAPDIAIVDIRMPPTQTDEGLRAAKEIREQHPGTGVLVLSQYLEEGYALELLQESAEGVGYLLKDRVYDLADFIAAVRRVAAGGTALDPGVVAQLVGRRRRDNPIDDLTAREREMLELMAEGLSNSAIAARVFLTERGVEKHVTSIFQKLRLPVAADTHRRVLAVVAFLRS